MAQGTNSFKLVVVVLAMNNCSLREFLLCQRNDLFEPGREEGILQITPSCSAKPGKAGQNRAKPGKAGQDHRSVELVYVFGSEKSPFLKTFSKKHKR